MNEPFKLPESWKWVRLGEVCEYDGGVWGEEPDDSEMCYFLLRSNNIRDGNMFFEEMAIRKVDRKYLPNKRLRTGDILVTTSSGSKDLLGKSAIFIPLDDKIYLFSNFTMRLRTKPEIIDCFYLHFYLQSPEAKNILKSLQDTTTGLRNLDRKEFLNQKIPLAPIETQRRIAAKLQELMQDVERARESCEKQLEAAKALPSAYLREVFESDDAKKWERKRLLEVAELVRGTEPGSHTYNDNGVGYRFIRISDVSKQLGQKIWTTSEDLVFCNEEDILMTFDGSPGVVYRGMKGAIASGIRIIKPKVEQILEDYLYYALQSEEVQKVVREYSKGLTILHASQSIPYIQIHLPSLSEQCRIASYLKEKMAYVENLRSKILNQKSAIESLPQAILRKTFRGEL